MAISAFPVSGRPPASVLLQYTLDGHLVIMHTDGLRAGRIEGDTIVSGDKLPVDIYGFAIDESIINPNMVFGNVFLTNTDGGGTDTSSTAKIINYSSFLFDFDALTVTHVDDTPKVGASGSGADMGPDAVLFPRYNGFAYVNSEGAIYQVQQDSGSGLQRICSGSVNTSGTFTSMTLDTGGLADTQFMFGDIYGPVWDFDDTVTWNGTHWEGAVTGFVSTTSDSSWQTTPMYPTNSFGTLTRDDLAPSSTNYAVKPGHRLAIYNGGPLVDFQPVILGYSAVGGVISLEGEWQLPGADDTWTSVGVTWIQGDKVVAVAQSATGTTVFFDVFGVTTPLSGSVSYADFPTGGYLYPTGDPGIPGVIVSDINMTAG